MQIPNVIASVAHSVLPTDVEGKILPLSSLQKVTLAVIALTTVIDAVCVARHAKYPAQQIFFVGKHLLLLTTAVLAKTEVRAASAALYILTSPRTWFSIGRVLLG